MNPLAVGLVVAVVMAGPPLYGMVEDGQIDGTTAIFRGLVVVVLVTVGSSWVLGLLAKYEGEQVRRERREAMLEAIADVEAQRKAAAEAEAERTNQARPS